jgi:hypothetical protein
VRNALGRGAELVGRVCLLLFLGSLWSVLRAAEEPAGWLAPSAFGGGLTGLAVKLASVGAAAAAQREPRTSALRIALRRINDASFMVSLVPLGVMLGRGGSRSGQRAAAVTLAPAGARQEPSRPPSQRPPEDRDRHPLVWNPDARLSNPWWLLHRPRTGARHGEKLQRRREAEARAASRETPAARPKRAPRGLHTRRPHWRTR